MSHFAVLVIHDKNSLDLDALLDPYWELDLSREELINDYRAEFNKKFDRSEVKKEIERILTETNNPNQYAGLTDEEIMEKYHGYYQDEYGNWGYHSNPNARWDWYSVGGRWANLIVKKNGEICLSFMFGKS